MTEDIAIAHEHYPARGGGEVVADELAECFNAPIITGWIRDREHSNHDVTEILENTPLNRLRKWFGNPLIRDAFYMFAWESVPTLRDYDVIIQSGNAPTWYVPEQHQTTIKYNHSPPRNPFDLFWREQSHTANRLDLINPGYVVNRLYKKLARHLWKNRIDEVDLWVCNSEVVAHRTKKYLGVPEEKIRIVYPPVDVESYEPKDGGEFYLSFGRLEPSKHTLKTINAFEELNESGSYQLVVAGDGNEREEIEAKADQFDWLRYEGFVSEDRKRRLYCDAKALVFLASNEDFGLVPIEAMASGTPVIGVDDGFTAHQISDGINGIKTSRKPNQVANAVRTFEQMGVEWGASELHEFTRQFGKERFCEEMYEVVEIAKKRNKIESEVSFNIPVEVEDDGS